MEWHCSITALIKKDCYNQIASNIKLYFHFSRRVKTNILKDFMSNHSENKVVNTIIIMRANERLIKN